MISSSTARRARSRRSPHPPAQPALRNRRSRAARQTATCSRIRAVRQPDTPPRRRPAHRKPVRRRMDRPAPSRITAPPCSRAVRSSSPVQSPETIRRARSSPDQRIRARRQQTVRSDRRQIRQHRPIRARHRSSNSSRAPIHPARAARAIKHVISGTRDSASSGTQEQTHVACPWVPAFAQGCAGKIGMGCRRVNPIGICAPVSMFDSGVRICRGKVHAEAQSRESARTTTKSTKGTKKRSRANARKTALCALCSWW